MGHASMASHAGMTHQLAITQQVKLNGRANVPKKKID